MNDAQSTIAGLKNQDCPGGGWTGMPAELERPIVADCLAHGVCGCVYGDAVKHIERLEAENENLRRWKALDKPLTAAMSIANSHLSPMRAKIERLKGEVAFWNTDARRLAGGLIAISEAPKTAPASVLRTIAYDIALNCMEPDTAKYQIERRAGLVKEKAQP